MEALVAINKRTLEGIALSTIAKAKLVVQAEAMINDLKRQVSIQDVNKRILNTYLDFDKLCFSMSEVDIKMSAHDFKRLNAYEFMRHKQLLQESIDRKSRK